MRGPQSQIPHIYGRSSSARAEKDMVDECERLMEEERSKAEGPGATIAWHKIKADSYLVSPPSYHPRIL
jgi:hypothetical protein